jgi:hypothetical protein
MGQVESDTSISRNPLGYALEVALAGGLAFTCTGSTFEDVLGLGPGFYDPVNLLVGGVSTGGFFGYFVYDNAPESAPLSSDSSAITVGTGVIIGALVGSTIEDIFDMVPPNYATTQQSYDLGEVLTDFSTPQDCVSIGTALLGGLIARCYRDRQS